MVLNTDEVGQKMREVSLKVITVICIAFSVSQVFASPEERLQSDVKQILKGQWHTICVKETKSSPYYTHNFVSIDDQGHIKLVSGWYRDNQCKNADVLLTQDMNYELIEGATPNDTLLNVSTQQAIIDVKSEEALSKMHVHPIHSLGQCDITESIKEKDQLTQISFSKSLTRLFFNKPPEDGQNLLSDFNHNPYRDYVEQSGLMG